MRRQTPLITILAVVDSKKNASLPWGTSSSQLLAERRGSSAQVAARGGPICLGSRYCYKLIVNNTIHGSFISPSFFLRGHSVLPRAVRTRRAPGIIRSGQVERLSFLGRYDSVTPRGSLTRLPTPSDKRRDSLPSREMRRRYFFFRLLKPP